MNEILQVIILGIVQGITEWLPVSSSGHLVIFQQLFSMEQPIVFDVFLHIGSLIVVLIVFWKDIISLAKGIFAFEKKAWRYAVMLGIATVPIGIAGFFLNDHIGAAFSDIRVVGFSLIFTSIVLFLSRYPAKKDKRPGFLNTAIMGLSQAIALLPGVSRSGITISSGLMQGIKKEDAARFSFLLFIPAILGATVLEIGNIGQVSNIPALALGMAAAIVSGFLSLRLLLKIIKNGNFHWFSAYCLVLGIAAIAYGTL